MDKNFESMQFSVRSSEINYPGLNISVGPKIRTTDQKRRSSRSKRSKIAEMNGDITEILASSNYNDVGRGQTVRSSQDSVCSIGELRTVKAKPKPRVPGPLFKLSGSMS